MDLCFKGYAIFSMDRVDAAVLKDKIPLGFKLKSDDTRLLVILGDAKTPYAIDWSDGRFVFCDETGVVEEVCFDPCPKWVKETLDDGTRAAAMAQPMGLDQIFAHPTYLCDRWTRNEQCLYCDIGSVLKAKKEEQKNGFVTTFTPEQLACVVELAQKEPGFRHFNINGGSIIGTRNGKSEVEWYCDYLNAINERINRNWMSSWVAIGPKKKDDVKRLHDTGVPALMMNTEVWGERLHEIICPGKSTHTGWEENLKRMVEAVDIFGKGRILSNFVSGVEMSQPWGFKDALSAVKHTAGGFEYLMAHGVLPRMSMWVIEQDSGLAGQPVPPFEYYIEIERRYLELRQKYDFPFPFYGGCRGCYLQDTLADWDYYFWGK